MGPGIKKDFQIPSTIEHVDQYPTIMQLLSLPPAPHVEGKVIEEIFAIETP